MSWAAFSGVRPDGALARIRSGVVVDHGMTSPAAPITGFSS